MTHVIEIFLNLKINFISQFTGCIISSCDLAINYCNGQRGMQDLWTQILFVLNLFILQSKLSL